MARLNASIKIVVLLGDTLFLLLAIAIATISSTVYSGKIVALNFEAAKRIASFISILSVAFVIFTLCGCCGAFNQTVRKGFCSGRRSLCCHQFLLLSMLILSTLQVEELQKRSHSIDMVIEDKENQFMTYDSFEKRLDMYFNRAYFETICSTDDKNAFLLDWIDEKCPKTMSQKVCALTQDQKKTCDTSCPLGSSPDSWTPQSCCPSKELCMDNKIEKTCPYHQCRLEILEEIKTLTQSSLLFLRSVSIISALMVTLTCLLICYNPRDDIEIELLKTGVMTEEDVDTIRKLKQTSGKNFKYDKGKKTNKNIDLDILHEQKEKKEEKACHSKSSRRTITRANQRIHPVKHSSP